MLHPLDIAVIVGWLALTLLAGMWFGRRNTGTTDDFFVTDRSLPWWVVGTSMVATTFAADTPLAVSGYVAAAGIADNWKWWFTGIGAVCTVFLFARLWRRSEVVTDAELTELRYGGRAAAVLRGMKALWFGILLNVLVIAWVNQAMRKIGMVVLGIPEGSTFLGLDAAIVFVLALFLLTVVYTGTAGMAGVVATDVIQFAAAMAGSIGLAVLAWFAVGGLPGLRAGFAEHGFDWERTTTLVPLHDPDPAGATAQLTLLVTVIWWAARNVDGNGYLAQRLFAAKDERHALWAYLWFTVANLCLRPWPWIVVGLAGMAMLGPLDDPETYYPRMMVALLPVGLFGLMVASFLAAFMSTIDTQLHWGASLVVNDVYRRFLRPDAPDREHLLVSRASVVLLAVTGAITSFWLSDIRFAWELGLSVTAGIGSVYVARWYWWRVNAWSELTAMLVAMVCTFAIGALRAHHPQADGLEPWPWLAGVPQGWLRFPFDATLTVLISVPCWVTVTLLTPAGDREHLRAFYRRVRPGGPGWRAVAEDIPGFATDGPNRWTALGIVAGNACVFGWLLLVGALLVGRWPTAAVSGLFAVFGTIGVAIAVRRETTLVPLQRPPGV